MLRFCRVAVLAAAAASGCSGGGGMGLVGSGGTGGAGTGGTARTGGAAATGGASATGGAPGTGGAAGTGGVSTGGRGTGGSGAAGGAQGLGGAVVGGAAGKVGAFVHPGLLFKMADLERMKAMVAARSEPYLAGWNKLRAESRAAVTYQPMPFAIVTRTTGGTGAGNNELRDNGAAAFLNAIEWVITGDVRHAQKAAEILNAWSTTLTSITGDADKFLAAGLYGYPFANAAEILRYTYPAWPQADVARLQDMLVRVFYPLNHEFLTTHAGSRVDHHFANWDAAQMMSIISIAVFADDRPKYNEAIDYFFNGPGNGNIMRAVYDGVTGQLQESGRDQAHAQLGIGLLASMCETAWNQGDDLYGTDNNRLLKGFEYTASYLLGNDVPFKTYSDQSRTFTMISNVNRDQRRPIYEMVWNHYTNRRSVAAPFTQQLAAAIRPEGWSGDHPSFGTILFTRPP